MKYFLHQLDQLVRTPSVSCTDPKLDMGNRAVVELLANWLDHLDFDIEILPVDDNLNKVNLIATRGSGPGGLVLAGHTDTVPYIEKYWGRDPLKVTVENNRAYGLGATDMKGFFPVVLAAIQSVIDTPLQQPLIVLATADEETSMAGARSLAEQGRPKARYAVIGEPTGLQPIRMHKGMAMEAVHIIGKSGHSSNPDMGINALDSMHDVMTVLKQFRQQLQAQYRHPGFRVDIPTLNLGCIHGGDNPNRICEQCELAFDLRPLPGMSLETLRAAIDQQLDDIAEKNRVKITRRSLFHGINAFEQSADSDLITTVEQLTGHSADSVAFATEAPFLQQLGMDVVVMGPGSIDQAHQPDEYISLDQVEPAVKILEGLIKRYCL